MRTTMRYCATPSGIAIIKGQETTRISKDVEKREPLDTVNGKLNCRATMANSREIPQKIKNGTII